MTGPDPRIAAAVLELIDEGLARRKGRLLMLGVCGAQGSGKSTLACQLLADCRDRGIAAAILSLDDLYLTRAERERLARDVHPLMRTRGVPGTHDVALGLAIVDALEAGEGALLPRFDKAMDDRADQATWERTPADCRLLILEGWCVGAVPQQADALVEPVNALEENEDPEGVWRRHVNAALTGDYQWLFGRMDRLVLLAAPCFEVVFGWRMQQERELRAACARDSGGVMDEAGVARFVQHYERLTRHILAEMPARADLTVRLDSERRPIAFEKLHRDRRSRG